MKEKSRWSSTRKRLEGKLLEERQVVGKTIAERDDASNTIDKNAKIIEQHLQSLIRVSVEISGLHDSATKLHSDKIELNAEVLKLKSQVAKLEKQLSEVAEERDDALQDMENAQSKEEGIIRQISELEARMSMPQDPDTPGKRQ
ncbi:unnamed protein product [Calypogeia fissa]